MNSYLHPEMIRCLTLVSAYGLRLIPNGYHLFMDMPLGFYDEGNRNSADLTEGWNTDWAAPAIEILLLFFCVDEDNVWIRRSLQILAC